MFIIIMIAIVIGVAIGVVESSYRLCRGGRVTVVLLVLLALRLGLLRERIARAAAAAGILNQETLLDQRLNIAIGGVLR